MPAHLASVSLSHLQDQPCLTDKSTSGSQTHLANLLQSSMQGVGLHMAKPALDDRYRTSTGSFTDALTSLYTLCGTARLTSCLFSRATAIKNHGHCCVALRRLLLLLLHGQPWLGGALLLRRLVAWGVAMRQQAIQHHWRGRSRAARWKEACEARAFRTALSTWRAPCLGMPLHLQKALMQMQCIAFNRLSLGTILIKPSTDVVCEASAFHRPPLVVRAHLLSPPRGAWSPGRSGAALRCWAAPSCRGEVQQAGGPQGSGQHCTAQTGRPAFNRLVLMPGLAVGIYLSLPRITAPMHRLSRAPDFQEVPSWILPPPPGQFELAGSSLKPQKLAESPTCSIRCHSATASEAASVTGERNQSIAARRMAASHAALEIARRCNSVPTASCAALSAASSSCMG